MDIWCTIFSQESIDILKRALLSCPNNHKLHIQRLREAYVRSYSQQAIGSYLVAAEKASGVTNKGLLTIYTEYIAHLKRLLNKQSIDTAYLRSELERCAGQLLENEADPFDEYGRFAAEIEFDLKDFDRGRVWYNTVLNNANNRDKAVLWIEFARLCKADNVDAARK